MKAILCTKYGTPDVLQLGDVPKPTPRENEVLIKVHAATVTPGDCEIRRFEMHVLFWIPVRLLVGIRKPKQPILGMELAGEIESVGKEVKGFRVGDKVFAGTGLRFGAYAEYISLKANKTMAIKPPDVGYEDAATIPTAGQNALHYVRKLNIEPGQKVLIIGAGGCFGTYGVQLAKYYGAEVTAVDSGDKLDTLKSIGADYVIDYTREDFTKNGETYDAIFDVAGKNSVLRNMKSLKKKGRYVLATPWVIQVTQGLWTSMISDKKFVFELAGEKSEDLVTVSELISLGKVKPVIDRHFPLEEVPAAHRYVESGQKIGNVVITMKEKQ